MRELFKVGENLFYCKNTQQYFQQKDKNNYKEVTFIESKEKQEIRINDFGYIKEGYLVRDQKAQIMEFKDCVICDITQGGEWSKNEGKIIYPKYNKVGNFNKNIILIDKDTNKLFLEDGTEIIIKECTTIKPDKFLFLFQLYDKDTYVLSCYYKDKRKYIYKSQIRKEEKKVNLLEREDIQLVGVLINPYTKEAQDIYYKEDGDLIYKDTVDGYIKGIMAWANFEPTQKCIPFSVMVNACESTEDAVGILYGKEYFILLKSEDAYCFTYKDLVTPMASYKWKLDNLDNE